MWTQEDVEKAFVEVRKKALADKEFRKVLLANPNNAIAQVSGKDVPAAFKIKVIESDPAYHATYVLPQMVSDDLSDEDLEKVAGGGDCVGHACAGDVSCVLDR